jgi:hypothetical protein
MPVGPAVSLLCVFLTIGDVRECPRLDGFQIGLSLFRSSTGLMIRKS